MDELKHPFKQSYKGNITMGIIEVFGFLLLLAVEPHHWFIPLLLLLNGIVFIWSGLIGKRKAQQNKNAK